MSEEKKKVKEALRKLEQGIISKKVEEKEKRQVYSFMICSRTEKPKKEEKVAKDIVKKTYRSKF